MSSDPDDKSASPDPQRDPLAVILFLCVVIVGGFVSYCWDEIVSFFNSGYFP